MQIRHVRQCAQHELHGSDLWDYVVHSAVSSAREQPLSAGATFPLRKVLFPQRAAAKKRNVSTWRLTHTAANQHTCLSLYPRCPKPRPSCSRTRPALSGTHPPCVSAQPLQRVRGEGAWKVRIWAKRIRRRREDRRPHANAVGKKRWQQVGHSQLRMGCALSVLITFHSRCAHAFVCRAQAKSSCVAHPPSTREIGGGALQRTFIP